MDTIRKYKLTSESRIFPGNKLHFRIEALRSFDDVKEGDLGGWIQTEHNLSHLHTCWVYDNARVSDSAKVSGRAKVRNHAVVEGSAVVDQCATVLARSLVGGEAWVSNHSKINHKASVKDRAWIFGKARISGDARVCGRAIVTGDARVKDDALVYGTAMVDESATIAQRARVAGTVHVNANASVMRDALKHDTINMRCIHDLTITDDHICYGCVTKTIDDWVKFLDSDEVIETPRNTTKFKMIETTLRCAIELAGLRDDKH